MTLSEYQKLAQRTARTDLSPTAHLMNGILGLAGETGEVADLIKKAFYQDGREITDKLFDELGDVLWYVQEIATSRGFDLNDVAEHNIEKLKRRYPEGFSAERSLHREGEHGEAGSVE